MIFLWVNVNVLNFSCLISSNISSEEIIYRVRCKYLEGYKVLLNNLYISLASHSR